MQVTLSQTQIEQAIADYIGCRMHGVTREDMEIDLRATRGPEGYTAAVVVNADKANTRQRPTPVSTESVGMIGGATLGVQLQEEADAIEADEAETAAEEADVEQAPEPETETVEEAPEPEAEPEAPAAEAPAEEEAPKTERRSIFADMKKPVNEKAEAA